MRVDFNEDKALAMFKILDEQWRKKTGVFEGVVLPQDRWLLPMKTNQEKANFLFYSAIFMRGAIISEDPFRFLVSFWESSPKLYDPKFIISQELGPSDIANVLMNIMPKSRNGNGNLKNAFNLYKVEQRIKATKDKQLLEDWRRLQTSDHFYYMCTKYFNDGDVHKYFNPYNSPHQAFVFFMNVYADLIIRLKKCSL